LKTDSSAHFGVAWSSSADDKRLFAGAETLRLFCHVADTLSEFAALREEEQFLWLTG
jgi:hypothetical protein